MPVAYIMASRDNDSCMFDSTDAGILRCPTCKFVTNRDYIPPTFRLRRKQYDLSVTFDHIHIVSERFRQFCRDNAFPSVEFRRLPANESHHVMLSTRIVLIDRSRTELVFEDLCEECKRYASTGGSLPIFLLGVQESLPTGIYATDVSFGSWDEREPFLIVSPDVRDLIELEGFKGISYTPISK